MASSSRAYILSRRGLGIGDLSSANLIAGDMDIDQATMTGVYSVNCTHQVGIATSQEIGLAPERFPIRVILTSNPGAVPAPANDAVCSYWKLTTAANVPIPYSRRPIPSGQAIETLYKISPRLDDTLWLAYRQLALEPYTSVINADIDAQNAILFPILSLIMPNAEQIVAAEDCIRNIINLAVANHVVPYFKVWDNVYLKAEPHGVAYQTMGNAGPNVVSLLEAVLCMTLNHGRLKSRYDNVADGVITLASYSIASMFRHGLFESYEHQEYYTAIMSPVTNQATQYAITGVRPPAGQAIPAHLALGTVIDVRDNKLVKQMVELSNLMVVSSGLMHYLFNHTTGGTVVTGTLLSVLTMYKLITPDLPFEAQERITSVFYEALHPSNKRAIANIVFKNTGVTTHGRCASSPRYDQLALDAFTQIRANPYPAGSHKAFICLQALRRVLQSGLAPFLPWASQLNSCVQMCTEVLRNGARSHVGAAYYTGDAPIVQPSSIDLYLPELAAYVNTFNRGDSLAFSPHMADDIGRRSAMNWQNLLRDLKGKDISATSVDTVKKFLETTGAVHFAFDPDDQSTWAQAVADANIAKAAIDSIFA